MKTIVSTHDNDMIAYARDYSKTVSGAHMKQRFSNDILYNLTAMAIEKYLTGFLQSRNYIPVSHTLEHLGSDTGKYIDVDYELINKLKWMDSFQQICSMDYLIKAEPNNDEISHMLEILNEVKSVVEKNLK